MKGSSDKYPKIIVQSNGKTQVRYNITEITEEDMNKESKISFDFDYVEIEGELTKGKIIDKIISEIHSKDGELALINNEIVNPGTSEYAIYQTLRVKAKNVADSVL